MNRALIVIDMQNDFAAAGGSLATKEAINIVNNVTLFSFIFSIITLKMIFVNQILEIKLKFWKIKNGVVRYAPFWQRAVICKQRKK